MKNLTAITYIFAVTVLVAAWVVITGDPQAQAQEANIVGTWLIEYENTDVVTSFHADGTVTTVTEFSLTHPDTTQIGIWWREGDVIHWVTQGFTLAGQETVPLKVTGTVQINSADEISIDALVYVDSVAVDDPPLVTGTRMQPSTES